MISHGKQAHLLPKNRQNWDPHIWKKWFWNLWNKLFDQKSLFHAVLGPSKWHKHKQNHRRALQLNWPKCPYSENSVEYMYRIVNYFKEELAIHNKGLHYLAAFKSNVIIPVFGNSSKIGGMNGVFQGLAWLLRGICQGQSWSKIPRSSPASLRKTSPFPTFLLGFTF